MHSRDSISNGANLSPHTRQVALVICSSANSVIELTFRLCEIYLLGSPFRDYLLGSFSLAYSLNLAYPPDNLCHLGRVYLIIFCDVCHTTYPQLMHRLYIKLFTMCITCGKPACGVGRVAINVIKVIRNKHEKHGVSTQNCQTPMVR